MTVVRNHQTHHVPGLFNLLPDDAQHMFRAGGGHSFRLQRDPFELPVGTRGAGGVHTGACVLSIWVRLVVHLGSHFGPILIHLAPLWSHGSDGANAWFEGHHT
jgi:hypothetical protein